MATTPNLSLNKPAFGASGWDVSLNDNFDKIDAASLTVDKVGQGYFVGVGIEVGDSANTVVSAAIDRIGLFQFVLPFRATFNRIGTRVKVAGGAGKNYGVALFDKDFNLIVETGALDANSAQVNITTVALITVEPGVYFLGQTSDSTTTQCSGVQMAEHGSILANLATKRRGHSNTTAPSPGTFPASLTLDVDSGFNPVLTIFTRE